MRRETMIAPMARQEGDTATVEGPDDDGPRWRSERRRDIDLLGVGQELVETRPANHPDRIVRSWFHDPDSNVNPAKVLASKSKHSRNMDLATVAPVIIGDTHRHQGGSIVEIEETIRPATRRDRLDEMDTRTRHFVMAAARIAAGLLWLANLHWKVAPNFGEDTKGGLYKYTRSAVDNPVWGVWKSITENLVLPHFHLFGWIVILTDGTLAALLLIGYRTRLVALVGAFNAIPIFLSVAYRANEWPWSYALIFFLHLMLFAVPPGDHAPRIDKALAGPRSARNRAFIVLGTIATVVGAIGWFLARHVDFASRQVALFGYAKLELKLLWFNGLAAVLTIAFGVTLIVAARMRIAGLVAAVGFAAMALVALSQENWNNVSAGAPAIIGTSPNAAFWAMFAVGAGVMWFRDRHSVA